MLEFLTRPRRTRPAHSRARRALLALEELEGRDCPSGPGISLQLSASVVSGTTVLVTGVVHDKDPANCTVQISGEVDGTVTTDSNGEFSLTTPAAGLGTITAQATDSAGLTSNTVQTTLACNAPSLTLTSVVGSDGVLTLSGQATDLDGGGDIVTFSGVAGGSATTDVNGNFSFTTTDWGLSDVTASTTDVWGQGSNTPTATVAASGPVITNFQAVHGTLNTWTFQGQVTNENAAGLVVQIGGLPSLRGQSTTVQENGWFYLTIDLQDGEQGTANAQTTDGAGLTSNLALAIVRPLS